MKAWSVIGLLFAAAILATIPKNGPGADMMGLCLPARSVVWLDSPVTLPAPQLALTAPHIRPQGVASASVLKTKRGP